MDRGRMNRALLRVAGVAGVIAFIFVVLSSVGARLPQGSGLGKLDATQPIPYFIADGTGKTGYRASDRELALWALQAWQRAAGGRVRFEPASESKALVRLHWASPDEDEFGETQPFMIDGRRGADVYIVLDVDALGPEYAASVKNDDL